jgi:hypothetical protein
MIGGPPPNGDSGGSVALRSIALAQHLDAVGAVRVGAQQREHVRLAGHRLGERRARRDDDDLRQAVEVEVADAVVAGGDLVGADAEVPDHPAGDVVGALAADDVELAVVVDVGEAVDVHAGRARRLELLDDRAGRSVEQGEADQHHRLAGLQRVGERRRVVAAVDLGGVGLLPQHRAVGLEGDDAGVARVAAGRARRR